MTSDLDAFWIDAEERQSLSPAIVNYTIEELGDLERGAFLMWCFRADRWPVGGVQIQFRWGGFDSRRLKGSPWYRAAMPHVFSGKFFRRNKNGEIGKRPAWDHDLVHELFPTARAAFEFLYTAWQKLSEDEMRALMEAV